MWQVMPVKKHDCVLLKVVAQSRSNFDYRRPGIGAQWGVNGCKCGRVGGSGPVMPMRRSYG